MKIDAHYYAVLAFSRAVGFKKEVAGQIAYASQFVDDAKINHIVLDSRPDEGIEYDLIEGRPSFFNMATCHSYFRIKTFNYNAMINNTTAFHFVPGCEGEGFERMMRCKEGSPIIDGILEEALESADPIRFGMVLHPYADTFAHQGFSGLLSKVNDIKDCEHQTKVAGGFLTRLERWAKLILTKDKFERFFDRAVPAYGHGQASHYPDYPYLEWHYQYDYSDRFSDSFTTAVINNPERYRRGFEQIREVLVVFLEKHPQFRDLEVEFRDFGVLFDTLLARKTDRQRVQNWQKVLVQTGLFNLADPMLDYDANLWLREAFVNFDEDLFDARKVEEVRLAVDFAESSWYRYYLAVHWYKKRFFEYSSEYLLDIPC